MLIIALLRETKRNTASFVFNERKTNPVQPCMRFTLPPAAECETTALPGAKEAPPQARRSSGFRLRRGGGVEGVEPSTNKLAHGSTF